MIDPEILGRITRILELMEKEKPDQTDAATLTKMFRKLHSDLSLLIKTEQRYPSGR